MDLLKENGNLITKESKLTVLWNEFPENMSEAAKAQIISEISSQYGVSSDRIEIKKKPIILKKTAHGSNKSLGQEIKEEIFNEANLSNIYLDFINENHIKIDIDDFNKLDRLITSQLTDVSYDRNSFSIKRVWGKNILSYKDFDKTFTNGIELLQSVPQNGGGKTNFINLCQFVLFGEYRYLSNRTKLSHVFNDNTNDDTANIFCELGINSNTYLIGRVLTKKKAVSQNLFFIKLTTEDKADVFFDTVRNDLIDIERHNPSKKGYFGINLTKGKPALTQTTIESYIGSIDDFFYSALMTSQNAMKWLETKPTERVLLFYDYFGLSTLNNKLDVAKTEYNKFKKTSMLDRVSVPDVKVQIAAKQEEVRINDRKKSEVEALLVSEEANLANIDEEIKSSASTIFILPDDMERFDKISKESQLNELSAKNALIEKTAIDEHQYNLYLAEISKIEAEILSVTAPAEDTEAIKALQKSKDVYSTPAHMTSELDSLIKSRDGLRVQYTNITTEISVLETSLASLGENIICEHCTKIISDTTAKKQEINTVINGLKAKLQPLQEQGSQYNDAIAKLNVKIAVDKQSFIDDTNISISILEKQVEDWLKTEKNRLSAKQQGIKGEIDKINTARNNNIAKDNIELNIKLLSDEITQYDTNIKKINANMLIRNSIAAMEVTKGQTVSKIKELNNLLSDIKTELRLAEIFINEKELLLKELAEDIKKDSVFSAYMLIHDKFNGISRHIIVKYLPTINKELHDILSDLTGFDVQLRFEDKAIEFYFIDSKGSRELFRASEYQKTMASMALHYVLMKLTTINIPNFLFVDEIFGAVGTSNMRYVQAILIKMTEIYDTVFLITHNKEFMEISNNFMLVARDGEGYSVLMTDKNIKDVYFTFLEEIEQISMIEEKQELENNFYTRF